jgi:hypothetical protein
LQLFLTDFDLCPSPEKSQFKGSVAALSTIHKDFSYQSTSDEFTGPEVMILKTFSPNNLAKKLAYSTQSIASLREK